MYILKRLGKQTNNKKHLSDEIEGCVTQLETGDTGTEALYECKIQCLILLYAFFERFTILNVNPVFKYYYTATGFWFRPVIETEREI